MLAIYSALNLTRIDVITTSAQAFSFTSKIEMMTDGNLIRLFYNSLESKITDTGKLGMIEIFPNQNDETHFDSIHTETFLDNTDVEYYGENFAFDDSDNRLYLSYDFYNMTSSKENLMVDVIKFCAHYKYYDSESDSCHNITDDDHINVELQGMQAVD